MTAPVSVTASDILNFYNKTYDDQTLELGIIEHHVHLQRIKKADLVEGANNNYRISLSRAKGTGNSLSDLIDQNSQIGEAGTYCNVLINTGNDYAVINFDEKSVRRAAGNKSAVADLVESQVEGLISMLGSQIAEKFYGSGNGMSALITNIAYNAGATTSIVVTNQDDIYKFEPGMEIQFLKVDLATLGTTSTPASGDYTTITAVNEDTKTLTVTSFTPSGASSADNFAAIGRRGVVAAGTTFPGLAAWFPLTAPSGTTVGNSLITLDTNRTGYQYKLGGHRLNDTSIPIDEAAFRIWQKIDRVGGRPTAIYISTDVFRAMAVRQWSRVVPNSIPEGERMGASHLALRTPKGEIPFVVGSYMPNDRCYVLDETTIKIGALALNVKKTPGMTEQETLGLISRDTTAANGDGLFQLNMHGFQMRFFCWPAVKVTMPAYNGVFAVSIT